MVILSENVFWSVNCLKFKFSTCVEVTFQGKSCTPESYSRKSQVTWFMISSINNNNQGVTSMKVFNWYYVKKISQQYVLTSNLELRMRRRSRFQRKGWIDFTDDSTESLIKALTFSKNIPYPPFGYPSHGLADFPRLPHNQMFPLPK